MALGNNPTQLDVVKEVKRLDADKANSSSLATVATTGSYNDLTDQPTQPTVDQTYNSASTNAQSGTAVAGALSPVVAIAEGKTKSYVIQSQSNITGTKDANDEYTGVSAITGVTIADLKLGDLILIKDLNVPDYWVSQLNKTGDVVTSVSLSKMETTKVDLTDYVTTNTAQTIIGAKTLSTDLTFNASGQTQLIWKTSGTTTGFIRSGISGSDKYIVTQANKHYWGSIANTNRVIFDPVDKSLRSETNENISLGTSGYRWRNIYGVNVYATSDRRLKENIKDAELDCGEVIDKLPIKEFNFKSDEDKKVVVGAIAQELMEILPEKYRATLVSGSEDTSYSINEGKLLFVAIGALKDEMKKTKDLEARLERIEKLLEK